KASTTFSSKISNSSVTTLIPQSKRQSRCKRLGSRGGRASSLAQFNRPIAACSHGPVGRLCCEKSTGHRPVATNFFASVIRAGRLRPTRKSDKISENIKCLVAFGVNDWFFGVPLGVSPGDQIRICIGSGFRIDFRGNTVLLRLG